jgi:hypothetical protein
MIQEAMDTYKWSLKLPTNNEWSTCPPLLRQQLAISQNSYEIILHPSIFADHVLTKGSESVQVLTEGSESDQV